MKSIFSVLIFGLFFRFDIQAGFLPETESSGLETLPFYSALLKGDLINFSEQWDKLSSEEKNKAFRRTAENGDNLFHLLFRAPFQKKQFAEKAQVILWQREEEAPRPLKIFQMLTHKNATGETPFDMIQDADIKKEFQARLQRLSERIKYEYWNDHIVKASLAGMVSFFLLEDSLTFLADGNVLDTALQTAGGLVTAGMSLFFCQQAFSSITTLRKTEKEIRGSRPKEDLTQTSFRSKM